MARETKGLRDGNGRVARLARWLAQAPSSESVDTLMLEHKDDGEWKRLQTWDRAIVSQSLATEIDSVITELANELGVYLTARVVWFDAKAGTYWTEHALRVQPEDMEGMQAFDGTAQSAAIQLQRHQERMFGAGEQLIRSSTAALTQTNTHLADSNRLMGAENTRLREDLWALREEKTQLEARCARLEAQLEEAIGIAEKQTDKANESDQQGNVVSMIGAILAKQPAAASSS